MSVHNHGTEDGPGIGCRERRLPDGSLRGQCMANDYYYRILRKMGGLQVLRCDPAFDAFMNGARWVNEDGDVMKPLRFDTREAAHDEVVRMHDQQMRTGGARNGE